MSQIKSKLELLLLILGLSPSLASTAFFCYMASQIQEVFGMVNSEMPLLSQIFSKFYPITIIFPTLVFLLWKYWPYKKARMFATIIFGILVGLITHAFYIWILFTPINILGKP